MKELRLLIIGFQWPEPRTTAAGRRTMQLIHSFQVGGYSISFASAGSKTPYSEDLRIYGIEARMIKLNDASFDAWLKELEPAVVLFDRFLTEEQFGWRVARNCPSSIRILDTQDLHSLRASRESSHAAGKAFDLGQWRAGEVTLRELASIYRSDITLVISRFELRLLRETLPGIDPLLYHLPFMEDPVNAVKFSSFGSCSGFIFLGNGRHHPNVDGLLWLHEMLWPAIRQQLPQAVLQVYGAYFPGAVRALHNPGSGFYIRGWIPDAREIMRKARVQLAPLRFGAGLKGKLIDSMASGCPFITTAIGAEGMLEDQGWEGCIARNTDEFVSHAIALYTDDKAWSHAQQIGAALINRDYDRASLASAFLARVEDVRGQLNTFRSENIIGAMMMHHRMASTMYLGKYIESKNRTDLHEGEY